MIKYCKILDEETGLVQLGAGCSDEYYKSIGMKQRDVEESEINNNWYLTDKCPHYTDEEKEQMERERVANLKLTKADFWIALLKRNITKAMVREKINLILDETLKAITLIRLDDANNFWRGDTSMDIVGAMFGLTSKDLDYLFEHKEFPSENNN